MSRLPPLSRAQLSPEQLDTLREAETLMGFLPNDVLTMARWPAFLEALRQLVRVIAQATTQH